MTTGAKAAWSMNDIFRSHHDWLRRWLRPRTPTTHLVDDVAAETMLRVLTISHRETIGEPRAIMTVIARRILLDLRARDALQQHYEAAIAHLPPAMEPSAEERMLILEALARIDRVLRPLSANARSAFLLSQVDGLRHAEIAARLGLSVSMVRKHIAAVMRACYRETGDAD